MLISRIWKPARIATLAMLVALPMVLTGTAPTSAQNRDPVVVLDTTKGQIAIRVYQNLVPNTSRAWLGMVDEGFYNGLSFHRVESWVVQGGCPIGNGTGNYTNPATGRARYLPLEINRSLGHGMAGMVAMARTSNPNSASCQFYILRKPMPQLNGQYTVFGKVIQGLQNAMALRVGDRILSASIAQGGGGGGGGGWGNGSGGGGGGGSAGDSAVPYISEPQRPPGQPHGDPGF